MPSVDSAAVAVDTAVSTPPDPPLSTPFQRPAGTLMLCAITCSVPDVGLRIARLASTVHGLAWPGAPNPSTKYASSAVIAVCCDALGTTNSIGSTGPVVSLTPALGCAPVQVSTQTSDSPTSTWVSVFRVQVTRSPAPLLAVGSQYSTEPLKHAPLAQAPVGVASSLTDVTPTHDPGFA